MSEGQLCRIIKYEDVSGTYFIAQRRIWKTRLFSESGYDWESFCLKVDYYSNKSKSFKRLHQREYTTKEFKDISYAEHACNEWVRVNNSDKIVKVWSEI
jgi:hypothetical protein